MADDDEMSHIVPYTATDAKVEQLEKRIGEMQARYDEAIKSYQDANRQLFAALNRTPAPAAGQSDTRTSEDAPAPVWSVEGAEKAFMARYTRTIDN